MNDATKNACDIPIFLNPFSEELFRSNYFEKNVLTIQRNESLHFNSFVDPSHIDELVTSVRIPPTNLNLAQGDTPLPLESYCIGGAYVEKARVLALHQEGATIILRSVEQWSLGLNRLKIIAEKFFDCECQINVYITPPNQKSTPPHWDTHDLIIMQIAGSKVWRLFEGERTLPLSDERFRIGNDYVSNEHKDVVLNSGDTLYLPRGVIHEPVAQTYSIHVSIGIHTVRWHDVLRVALRLVAEREGSLLRRSIPGFDEKIADSPTLEILAQLIEPEIQSQAIGILRKRFEDVRAVDLQGDMLNIADKLTTY